MHCAQRGAQKSTDAYEGAQMLNQAPMLQKQALKLKIQFVFISTSLSTLHCRCSKVVFWGYQYALLLVQLPKIPDNCLKPAATQMFYFDANFLSYTYLPASQTIKHVLFRPEEQHNHVELVFLVSSMMQCFHWQFPDLT